LLYIDGVFMKENATASTSGPDLGASLGFLLLRLWLSVRAIFTGIEKFAGSKSSDAPVEIDGAINTYGLTSAQSDKFYSLGNHHGVPDSLYVKLQSEPLLPEFALKFFDASLGYVLIALGLTLLLGIASRISLFLMGLVYIGLTLGLILLKQDAGIAWLGIHVLLVAFALFHVRYNRFALMRKL